METGLIFLLITGSFCLFGVVLLLLFFRNLSRRIKVRVNIIYPDKTRTTHKFKNIEKSFSIGKCTYIYNNNNVIKDKRYYEIYYYYDNPESINFNSVDLEPPVTGENLKNIIETDLINQLFKGGVLTFDNMMILLIAIGVLISAGGMLLIWFKGVTIADNAQNVQIITDIIKSVIGG